jgi:hypothetical protein
MPGCGGSPTAPGATAALSERLESEHYVFAYAAGDRVDAEWQEVFHRWATEALGVSPTQRITYNKYTSRAHMGQVVGVSNTNAYADGPRFAIHTLWPTDNHEVVHLYSYPWGMPVALFTEGLAVAFQANPAAQDLVPKWNGTPIHELARRFRASGRLLPIGQLAATSGFRQYDSSVTYPEAGSFVRFLIDQRGLDPIKRLFASVTADSGADTVRRQVETIYGTSLEELEREWLAFLDQG